MATFMPANFLLPEKDFDTWSVIACDQFTSEPSYWEGVIRTADGYPSTLNLIFPEYSLSADRKTKIADIHKAMEDYLEENILKEHPGAFVYIERTMQDGCVRRGLLGVIDLEEYDFHGDVPAAVKATEQTVLERIPPRVEVREGAPLELTHVLLLMDDASDMIMSEAAAMKADASVLYDTDLMQDGGHITGYLIDGEEAARITALLDEYESARKAAGKTTMYTVGDGNHSLASAKACFENLKKNLSASESAVHPARYASVELCNIHDEAQKIEPIHRLVITEKGIGDLLGFIAPYESEDGYEIDWIAGGREGKLHLKRDLHPLPVGALQKILDDYIAGGRGTIDYIHGDDSLVKLAGADNAIGFFMPPIDKSGIFSAIDSSGSMPRKTFSIGLAREKRYYMEARRIL